MSAEPKNATKELYAMPVHEVIAILKIELGRPIGYRRQPPRSPRRAPPYPRRTGAGARPRRPRLRPIGTASRDQRPTAFGPAQRQALRGRWRGGDRVRKRGSVKTDCRHRPVRIGHRRRRNRRRLIVPRPYCGKRRRSTQRRGIGTLPAASKPEAARRRASLGCVASRRRPVACDRSSARPRRVAPADNRENARGEGPPCRDSAVQSLKSAKSSTVTRSGRARSCSDPEIAVDRNDAGGTFRS